MKPLVCGRHTLDLSRPLIMGILNVTPDSFSDGGRFVRPEHALQHAREMAEAGADIIDIGGESTRPGAEPVGLEAELRRVIPLIETLAPELPVPVSVDTGKPEVMRAAVAAGAGMLNDVYALRAPGAIEAAAACDVPVCLMHMQGKPRTMQSNPRYRNVVREVGDFLRERAQAALAAGIRRENILLDPGFGFGKTLDHNLVLLGALNQLAAGYPLLVGLSRKRMIGALLDDAPVGERLHGSIAAAVIAVMHGANIVRVHDVKPTVEALKVCRGVLRADSGAVPGGKPGETH